MRLGCALSIFGYETTTDGVPCPPKPPLLAFGIHHGAFLVTETFVTWQIMCLNGKRRMDLRLHLCINYIFSGYFLCFIFIILIPAIIRTRSLALQ